MAFHGGQRQQQVTGLAADIRRAAGAAQLIGGADRAGHRRGQSSHRITPDLELMDPPGSRDCRDAPRARSGHEGWLSLPVTSFTARDPGRARTGTTIPPGYSVLPVLPAPTATRSCSEPARRLVTPRSAPAQRRRRAQGPASGGTNAPTRQGPTAQEVTGCGKQRKRPGSRPACQREVHSPGPPASPGREIPISLTMAVGTRVAHGPGPMCTIIFVRGMQLAGVMQVSAVATDAVCGAVLGF